MPKVEREKFNTSMEEDPVVSVTTLSLPLPDCAPPPPPPPPSLFDQTVQRVVVACTHTRRQYRFFL